MGAGARLTKKRNPTANHTSRSRQMKPWSGRRLGRRRLASDEGTAHTPASLTTVGASWASHGGDWREPFASVQDGSPLGLEEVATSILVVAPAGLAAAT